MHSWNIFGARTNHGQTRTHKTHHGPDLREAITFPLIVFYVLGHGACTQMLVCLGTPKLGPKILEIGPFTTLEAHNFLCRLLIEVRFEIKL
jgi:hypothetical protein